jgi:hypothetical protein
VPKDDALGHEDAGHSLNLFVANRGLSLSKNMVFTYRRPKAGEPSRHGLVPVMHVQVAAHKVKAFVKALPKTLMAPLETLQVLTVHKCFRDFIFQHQGMPRTFGLTNYTPNDHS